MSDGKIETTLLKDDGRIPNSGLCLVVYRGFLPPGADAAMALFNENGWGGGWVNGIYPFHHYHSNAHEVLGCFRGWADVQFGGPSGVVKRIEEGDAVVIPAGVGHCNKGAGVGFGVVGCYPAGQEDWDLCRGEPGERPAADAAIAAVTLPVQDPVLGGDGTLMRLWRD